MMTSIEEAGSGCIRYCLLWAKLISSLEPAVSILHSYGFRVEIEFIYSYLYAHW